MPFIRSMIEAAGEATSPLAMEAHKERLKQQRMRVWEPVYTEAFQALQNPATYRPENAALVPQYQARLRLAQRNMGMVEAIPSRDAILGDAFTRAISQAQVDGNKLRLPKSRRKEFINLRAAQILQDLGPDYVSSFAVTMRHQRTLAEAGQPQADTGVAPKAAEPAPAGGATVQAVPVPPAKPDAFGLVYQMIESAMPDEMTPEEARAEYMTWGNQYGDNPARGYDPNMTPIGYDYLNTLDPARYPDRDTPEGQTAFATFDANIRAAKREIAARQNRLLNKEEVAAKHSAVAGNVFMQAEAALRDPKVLDAPENAGLTTLGQVYSRKASVLLKQAVATGELDAITTADIEAIQKRADALDQAAETQRKAGVETEKVAWARRMDLARFDLDKTTSERLLRIEERAVDAIERSDFKGADQQIRELRKERRAMQANKNVPAEDLKSVLAQIDESILQLVTKYDEETKQAQAGARSHEEAMAELRARGIK